MNNAINPFNTPFFQGAGAIPGGQFGPQQGAFNQQQLLGLLVALIKNGMNNQGANQAFGQQQGGQHAMGAPQVGSARPAGGPQAPGQANQGFGPGAQNNNLRQALQQIMQALPPQHQQAFARLLDQLGLAGAGLTQPIQNGGARPAGGPRAAGQANQAFGGAQQQAIKGQEKNGWLAPHGGYKKVGNGFEITKGAFKGHTATPMKGGKGYQVTDKNGQNKGVYNPPGGKQKIASPLTFDLNGNGKVDTTGTNKKFDINGDGKVDNSAWAGKGDGVLAFDKDGNGKFGEDGTELFGNNTGSQNSFANGFEALKAFAEKRLGAEAVADGKLDKREIAALDNDLRMKVDGQDKKLSELGVDSINLNYEEAGKNADANGNEHRQTGAFTQNGEDRQVNDVWFKYE